MHFRPSEPVVAYRGLSIQAVVPLWKGDPAGVLVSPRYRSVVWATPDQTAKCQTNGDHIAPHHDCGCGLYAYWTPEYVSHNMGPTAEIIALVTVEGDVEVHYHGLRAERMTVRALAINPGTENHYPHRIPSVQACLAALGWDVPIVHASQLQALAKRYGRPLPQEYRTLKPFKYGVHSVPRGSGAEKWLPPAFPVMAGVLIATPGLIYGNPIIGALGLVAVSCGLAYGAYRRRRMRQDWS